MAHDDYSENDYREPHLPPGTPPVIDKNADPEEAATLTDDKGDSDFPGKHPAEFQRGLEDDSINPGDTPDEAPPGPGDKIDTDTPSEIEIGGGKTPAKEGKPGGVTPSK
ncbi:hypothetical protein [Altericroceibacterium endophyticum]|uniref:Uncharacterized protein n=1 Tax=Altericroceibacterium endophyticum TaxID=1808508 RepID=A0A6I4T6L4_9SPHN|nr:hypothetical protein [Altericroceibacterium endophyticum]MXO66566.1 hypothetical protein [Altericroceibacterium endophyticum]